MCLYPNGCISPVTCGDYGDQCQRRASFPAPTFVTLASVVVRNSTVSTVAVLERPVDVCTGCPTPSYCRSNTPVCEEELNGSVATFGEPPCWRLACRRDGCQFPASCDARKPEATALKCVQLQCTLQCTDVCKAVLRGVTIATPRLGTDCYFDKCISPRECSGKTCPWRKRETTGTVTVISPVTLLPVLGSCSEPSKCAFDTCREAGKCLYADLM